MIARNLKLWLAGLGLISAGSGAVAQAQPEPQSAPAAAAPAAHADWIAYAVSVSGQLQDWMAEDAPPAFQVMSDLAKLQPASQTQAPIRLDVRLWIDPDGRISRIETSAGPRSGLDVDLAALARGRKLAAAPPAGLAFPIRLRLAIKPPEAPHAAVGSAAR